MEGFHGSLHGAEASKEPVPDRWMDDGCRSGIEDERFLPQPRMTEGQEEIRIRTSMHYNRLI